MFRLLKGAFLGALAMILVAFGVLWFRPFAADGQPDPPEEDSHAPSGLHLHPAEMEAAGIKLGPLEFRKVRSTRTLPGRIAYDATKHVAVVAVAEGVIESVLVNTGQAVEAGQALAVMRCPAIGMARSELISRESKLSYAQREYEWNADICDGIETLIYQIRKRAPVEEIEQTLAGKRLGAKRASLLNAYSQMLLAERLARSAADAGGAAVLSGRVMAERRAKADQATAVLLAEAEQTLFEAQQARNTAHSEYDAAQRRVDVARQELATLMGFPACVECDLGELPSGDDLTRFEVRSPIDGTIERREYSATERVPKGGEMFVVADTNSLWVEADIRGGDWAKLRVSEGDPVWVTTPATGAARWEANVVFIGREVDSASGAAPLVAAIDNREGKLRPGLFARVEAPTSAEFEALVAPSAAVVDLDGSPAVFVSKGGEFEPVIVKPGRRFGDWIEITSPLAPGSEIVTAGAFFLKSELLLAGEE
ncbi:MAG: efflux RND transporter periplasmic adaptor subunit [Planctomycetales bacterium]|nr:efflux RND transporter periplasmic adaptor subunit [Planctomycetales bacterium]